MILASLTDSFLRSSGILSNLYQRKLTKPEGSNVTDNRYQKEKNGSKAYCVLFIIEFDEVVMFSAPVILPPMVAFVPAVKLVSGVAHITEDARRIDIINEATLYSILLIYSILPF